MDFIRPPPSDRIDWNYGSAGPICVNCPDGQHSMPTPRFSSGFYGHGVTGLLFVWKKKNRLSEENQVTVRRWKKGVTSCATGIVIFTLLAFLGQDWHRTTVGMGSSILAWLADTSFLMLTHGAHYSWDRGPPAWVGFSWGAVSLQNPLFTGSTASVHKRKRHRETLDTHGHKCPEAQQSPLLQVSLSHRHDQTMHFSRRPKPFTHHQVMSAHKASWSHFFLTQI